MSDLTRFIREQPWIWAPFLLILVYLSLRIAWAPSPTELSDATIKEIIARRYLMENEPNEWIVHYVPQCGYARDRLPTKTTVTSTEVLKNMEGVFLIEPRYVERKPNLRDQDLEEFMQNL